MKGCKRIGRRKGIEKRRCGHWKERIKEERKGREKSVKCYVKLPGSSSDEDKKWYEGGGGEGGEGRRRRETELREGEI